MHLSKYIPKSLTLLLLSAILLFCNSCKKEESTPDDEFYVKYDFEKTISVGRIVTLVVEYKDADGNIRQTETKGGFETTIGPVKKGFQAEIIARDKYPQSTEYHLRLKLKIFTSKNNGPFAEKAVNDSSDPRSKAALYYTIK